MSTPGDVAYSRTLDNYLAQLATVSGAGSFVGGEANALTNSYLTPGTVVVINTNGAFFKPLPNNTVLASSNDFQNEFASINGGSDRARIFILLHEIAHTLQMIRGNDGGLDSNSQTNQRFNNDQIWRSCSGKITSFSNTPH